LKALEGTRRSHVSGRGPGTGDRVPGNPCIVYSAGVGLFGSRSPVPGPHTLNAGAVPPALAVG